MDVDACGVVVDLENDEWLLLRIDRPVGDGECSWLDVGDTGVADALSFFVSSDLGELLSTGTVSRLIDEFTVAAELGVCTAPLDSVSIDEIEVQGERLTTWGGAACGMGTREGRPRWLDRRACRCGLFTIVNESQEPPVKSILPLDDLIGNVIRYRTCACRIRSCV